MVLVLYGTNVNPPVRAVLITAKAIGLQMERVNVNLLEREHLRPDYLKMNPQHTVPTLDDDGYILWDSHAIITYLVSQYGTDESLYPAELKLRAKIDQRLHFDCSILYPRMRNIFCSIVIQNEKRIPDVQKEAILDAYNILEAFLENTDYMAADHLTVADFSILSSFSSVNNMVAADFDKLPRLGRWFERCKSLPYYKEANEEGLLGMTTVFRSKLE